MVRRVLAVAAVAVLVVPTVVRFLGDHALPALVAAASLTPYAVPPLAVALAFLLRGRAWRASAAIASVLALNLAWLVPLWVPDRAPASGATPLTVMTANLRLGEADPTAVVAAVRAHRVDVLALEELTPQAVSALHRAGLDRELPHRAVRAVQGADGAGLWSRTPVAAVTWSHTWSRTPTATIELRGRPVVVGVLHPAAVVLDGGRPYRDDYAATTDFAAGLDDATPTLLLGDLNASVDNSELRELMGTRFRDASELAGSGLLRTFSPSPRLPALLHLDHVLVDDAFGVTDTTVVDLPGSDHRALVARLGLTPRG
ncbi:endonuclease/exonuclease/phosphatase family protein [Oryzihumus sp.]